MTCRSRLHWPLCLLLCLPTLFLAALPAQADEAAPSKKQLPADQRAFNAARAIMDPEQRLTAMRSFVKNYPKSSRTSRADSETLYILVHSFPQRTAEIEQQAKLRVKHAGKGLSRLSEETYVAFTLTEGGATAVCLPLAEQFAKHAVDHLNEADYSKAAAAQYAKYKEPLPKPEVIHKEFLNTRTESLAALADVYLREGKKTEATPLIAQGFTFDPMVDDINTMRGRLAILDHNDALALDSFERAQLVGTIYTADRKKMMDLYRNAHAGSENGFAAELDARYTELFPPPFSPAAHVPVNTGHTVLLELFTGSACGPCVGGDLAVDAMLGVYPRDEVVALAFDQHIPEPDPLTNPDSVARGDFYDIAHTPKFVVDGQPQDLYGSNRDGSKDVYDKLTKFVDASLALPSSLKLNISATESNGLVHALAIAQLPSSGDIARLLTAAPVSDGSKPGKPATPATTIETTPAAEPHLVVNIALVEDEISYSGENGIRFHRMVVRSLAKPANSGFPVAADGSFTLDAAFDPSAISSSLTSYLDTYEEKNDKFGKIEFLTKDMTMKPSHLAVVAWVQDSVTRRILQSAFTTVGSQQKEAE